MIIDLSPGHASVMTSLQVSASLRHDSCCLFTALFGRGIFLLAALLVPSCVGLSDGHSDQYLLMVICSLWRYVDASVLVNETEHSSSSSLFIVCFTDAAKLAKSSFQKFQNSKLIQQQTPQIVKCSGYCLLTYGLSLSLSLHRHGSRSDTHYTSALSSIQFTTVNDLRNRTVAAVSRSDVEMLQLTGTEME
jgi:hypothetical protein